MSISSTTRKAGSYTGNGSTTQFPFSFKVFSASDVLVVRTDPVGAESNLVLGTDYTVALNADQDANPGGTITATTAPATGYLITATSQVQNLQPVTLTNQGAFYPKVINDAFDRLTILVQQVAEQVGRAVKVGISSSTTPDQLIAQLNTNVSNAASSASAASTSASTASSAATNASNSATAAANSAASIALPLSVASGGTGSTTAAAARTALEVAALAGSASQVFSVAPATGAAHAVRLDQFDPMAFYKADSQTPAFVKTGADTISVKAGTSAMVAGVLVTWAADTAITMPTLTAGTDYAIYACADGTIRADANWSAPTGYTTANSRKIGGFHYGQVASGTTVAGGSFATTGNGMIWTQTDVDNIAGINSFSIWDLKFRPVAADPRGMALVGGRTWVDIYLCSTDTATYGTSKAGTNIASGTVLPKIPAAFGGDGTVTYPSLNWWVANELARANQKRLMCETEFVDAAFGVTENQSIDATASTYPTTQRNAGYTSKYGIEQASGHHQVWGQDSNFYSEAASPAGSWKDVNGNNGAGTGRGQEYTFGTYGLTRVVLGGARTNDVNSGSRSSSWSLFPWSSGWYVGLRAACDHMTLV